MDSTIQGGDGLGPALRKVVLARRLKEVVLRHTVVGGYPDTMAIARDAYALARADMARNGVMHLERTAWSGDAHRTERRDMEAWLEEADAAAVTALLDEALDPSSPEGRATMALLWAACAKANGSEVGIDDQEDATYHWGEGERIALRRTLSRLRPELVEPDPAQMALL